MTAPVTQLVEAVGGLGLTAVSGSISTALSSALSSTTSLSTAFSSTTSANLSTALSTTTSAVASLSTAVGSGGSSVAPGNLYGLTLSNDGGSPNTVIDVAAGSCADSTNATTLTLTAFTKTTGAWASGTGNGGLDTGSVANSTWYHVYVISKAGGANVDVLLSKGVNVAGVTLPSTYTLGRRIGSIFVNSSGHIAAFTQLGGNFRWNVPVTDLNTSTTATSATLQTLTTPAGIKMVAKVIVGTNLSSSGNSTFVSSPDDTDTAPSASGAGPWTVSPGAAQWNQCYLEVRTNTSSQVRHRETSASGFSNLNIQTLGWFDDRGIEYAN